MSSRYQEYVKDAEGAGLLDHQNGHRPDAAIP